MHCRGVSDGLQNNNALVHVSDDTQTDLLISLEPFNKSLRSPLFCIVSPDMFQPVEDIFKDRNFSKAYERNHLL